MEYLKNKINIEKSNNDNNTINFGIKSPEIIFDILCNKLYKNPLKVMIQEYMSNARDSHREANCRDKPIIIKLPTYVENTLQIEDRGVGISPDRIKNVFVFLGESTKNQNNNETGGFGVGAKVAWAYTDSFTIYTIYDNIKYTYLAYIGNNSVGQLDLLYKEKNCNEENGTIIEVAIKPKDFDNVKRFILQTSHFWRVKPIIKNESSFKYQNNNIYRTNDLTLVFHDGYNDRYDDGYLKNRYSINVVVDGIVYENIRLNETDLYSHFNIPTYFALYVDFKIGELDIAVNRENLQYTDKTISCIKEKIKYNLNKAKEDIINFINSCHTISDIFKNKELMMGKSQLFRSFDFKFDDVDLIFKTDYEKNKLIIYDFKNSANVYNYYFERFTNRLSLYRYSDSFLKLKNSSNNSAIIYNDKQTKTFNRSKIKNWMIENKISDIQYIDPTIKPSESFFEDHKSFFNKSKDIIFNLSEIINNSKINEKKQNNNIIIHTVNTYDYSFQRNELDDFPNQTLLFDDYYKKEKKNYMKINDFINNYNYLNNTNFKLALVSKQNKIKLKSKNIWITFDEWYKVVEDEIYYFTPRSSIIGLKAHQNKFKIDDILKETFNTDKVNDPKVVNYIKLLNKMNDCNLKHPKNYIKYYNNLNDLFEFVFFNKESNIKDHKDMLISDRLIKKRIKRIKKLEKYIIDNYRLITKQTTNYEEEIIEFINLKYQS